MTEPYPWYGRVADGALQQGDLLVGCPIPVLMPDLAATQRGVAWGRLAGTDLEAGIEVDDGIIVTQSCDLAQGRAAEVVFCATRPLAVWQASDSRFRNTARLEEIRQGKHVRYHMLAKCDLPGLEAEIRIADLNSLFSLSYEFVVALAGAQLPRLRLLPPYREHLAQAFARFYMRVGLPVDIPRFR